MTTCWFKKTKSDTTCSRCIFLLNYIYVKKYCKNHLFLALKEASFLLNVSDKTTFYITPLLPFHEIMCLYNLVSFLLFAVSVEENLGVFLKASYGDVSPEVRHHWNSFVVEELPHKLSNK